MPAATALALSAALAQAQCLDEATRHSLIVLTRPDSHLVAVIAPTRGGELVSLQWTDKGERRELLHRGLDFCERPGWSGKAPVLWPGTGRNYAEDPARGDAAFGWIWQGKRYPMPIHGFARDQAWRVIAASKDAVTVRLEDSPATRSAYPFAYRFDLTYRISGDALVMTHKIVAGGNRAAMPFSLGNHITFALPLGGSGKAADATITSDPGGRLTLDAFGRPEGSAAQPPLDAVPVVKLGKLEALPLVAYAAGPARAQLAQPGGMTVRLSQTASRPATAQMVRYNLWGNAAAGFFSIEPWFGRQNALGSGEGLVRLAPGKAFTWTLAIEAQAP